VQSDEIPPAAAPPQCEGPIAAPHPVLPPRSLANDPLASVQALSDEEKIALFS
jgi:hypothetical protein